MKHKREFSVAFKIVVAIGLLTYIFSKVPLATVWQAIVQADRYFICLAFGVFLGIRYLNAYRTKIFTNAHRMQISIHQLVGISLTTTFYGLFLPGILAGGAIRWYKIARVDNMPAQSFTAIIYDRLMSTIGLVVIGIIFWIIDQHTQYNQIGLLLILILGILILTYIVVFNEKIIMLFYHLALKAPFVPCLIRDKITKILRICVEYSRIPHSGHLRIFCATLAFDLCGIFAMYLLALSIELPVTYAQIAWIRSIIYILTMLPLSFSGLGIREGSLIVLLQNYGVTPTDALAFSFLIFSSIVILAIIGGAIEMKQHFFSYSHHKPATRGPQ
jgi:uncharacterized protein (TIRG00374 family)